MDRSIESVVDHDPAPVVTFDFDVPEFETFIVWLTTDRDENGGSFQGFLSVPGSHGLYDHSI